MVMQSVLDRATQADICDDPFPHLVVRHALDGELYERLAAEFPRPSVMRKIGAQGKFAYEARSILADTPPDMLWHAFVEHHVAEAFFRQVLALFGDRIQSLHPDLECRLGKRLADLRPGIRFSECQMDVALEAQCIYSEASLAPTRIIGPHVDRPVALYAGLYYFRMDEDDSTGGDLELYRFKPGCRAYVAGTRQIPPRLVETVKVIPYEKNTLVVFPHSADSLHGVSTRSAATYPRRHVNFVGELAAPVYDLAQYPTVASLEASL
jgi:hypothetical protein